MNKLLAGLAALSLLFMSGCASFQDAVGVTGKAAATLSAYSNVKYYYENGVIDYLQQADLNEIEQGIVKEAINQVEATRIRLKQFRDSPGQIITNIPIIAFEFSKVKTAYMSVRGIVIAHEDEYDLEAWMTLVQFDAAAITLNNQFEELIEASESSAALMTALKFTDTVIKLATVL